MYLYVHVDVFLSISLVYRSTGVIGARKPDLQIDRCLGIKEAWYTDRQVFGGQRTIGMVLKRIQILFVHLLVCSPQNVIRFNFHFWKSLALWEETVGFSF